VSLGVALSIESERESGGVGGVSLGVALSVEREGGGWGGVGRRGGARASERERARARAFRFASSHPTGSRTS
jgi:hypothetical protein